MAGSGMRQTLCVFVGVFFCMLALTVSDADAVRDFGGALRMTWAAVGLMAFLAAFR